MRKHLLLLIFSLALPTGLLAGNTWQTATAIAEGETLSGTMDKNDTEEWYKIVIPKDGDVTLNVKTDATLVMRYVELHAKSSDTYLGSWGWKYLYEKEEPFTVCGLAPGTYYVHLSREEKAGSYTFCYTFTPESYANDKEPNDDEWKQASTTLVSGETIQGHLGYNYWDSRDQTDWYKINLKQSGSIELHLTTDKASPLLVRYVELYKVSGDYVSSLKYEYQYKEFKPVIVNDLVPGTYYVKIEREDKYGTYFLVWDSTLKLVGDVNDDGKITAADARAVADYIMGKTPAGFNIMMADVNEDGKINAVDVTSIIGIINKK